MNAPDWLNWRETPQQDDAGFRFLSDDERNQLAEGERYEYDECCSNQQH